VFVDERRPEPDTASYPLSSILLLKKMPFTKGVVSLRPPRGVFSPGQIYPLNGSPRVFLQVGKRGVVSPYHFSLVVPLASGWTPLPFPDRLSRSHFSFLVPRGNPARLGLTRASFSVEGSRVGFFLSRDSHKVGLRESTTFSFLGFLFRTVSLAGQISPLLRMDPKRLLNFLYLAPPSLPQERRILSIPPFFSPSFPFPLYRSFFFYVPLPPGTIYDVPNCPD